jgi:hypothetical protein
MFDEDRIYDGGSLTTCRRSFDSVSQAVAAEAGEREDRNRGGIVGVADDGISSGALVAAVAKAAGLAAAVKTMTAPARLATANADYTAQLGMSAVTFTETADRMEAGSAHASLREASPSPLEATVQAMAAQCGADAVVRSVSPQRDDLPSSPPTPRTLVPPSEGATAAAAAPEPRQATADSESDSESDIDIG